LGVPFTTGLHGSLRQQQKAKDEEKSSLCPAGFYPKETDVEKPGTYVPTSYGYSPYIYIIIIIFLELYKHIIIFYST
jgi:hypothetical protein